MSAFACWRAQGSFAVDGETFKIDQKIEHSKEYLFPGGKFILKFTVTAGKKKVHNMKFTLEEKKGVTLTTVTTGEEEIEENRSNDIYAKGLPGQANSIITLKLTSI